MIKPSEVCEHTAKLMGELLPLYLDTVRHAVAAFSVRRHRRRTGKTRPEPTPPPPRRRTYKKKAFSDDVPRRSSTRW